MECQKRKKTRKYASHQMSNKDDVVVWKLRLQLREGRLPEVESVRIHSLTIFKRYRSKSPTVVSGSIFKVLPVLSIRELSPGARSNWNLKRLASTWEAKSSKISLRAKVFKPKLYLYLIPVLSFNVLLARPNLNHGRVLYPLTSFWLTNIVWSKILAEVLPSRYINETYLCHQLAFLPRSLG